MNFTPHQTRMNLKKGLFAQKPDTSSGSRMKPTSIFTLT